MNNALTTQCPHCDTRFRLLPAQLEAAQGTVRCGVCRQVFNAFEYLENDAAAKAYYNDDFLIHDELDARLDAPEFEQKLARLAQQETELPAPAAPEPTPYSQETKQSPPPFTQTQMEPEPEQPKQSASSEPTQKAVTDFYQATEVTAAPYDEEAWAAALLAEEGIALEEDEEDTETKVQPEPELESTPEPAPELAEPEPQSTAHTQQYHFATIDANNPEQEKIELSIEPIDTPQAQLNNGYTISTSKALIVLNEPLQLPYIPQPSPWKHRLLWGSLCVIALVALIGQYGYFHFDTLARQENTRIWLQRLCPLLGCTLPNTVDVSQIKSSNLMVRPHPEFDDALLVDTVIYNRAPYNQVYPLIQLNVLDTQHQIVASRVFSPIEYLGGELAGSESMPAQTPIRISFEILKPTQIMEYYSVEFLPPRQNTY